METDEAPSSLAPPLLQLRGDPSSSSLLPPTMHDETSSSTSSRPPKRSCEASPTQRTTSRRDTVPRDQKVSWHHSISDEVLELRRLTTTLQVQLQQSQAEICHLRSQLEAEYDAGFYRGQAQGFREAQELSSRGELAAPPNKPTRHSRRQVTPDIDEREAKELHHAMQQSCRAVWQGPPETSTPGAGPSRARGPKGSGEP